MAKTVLVINSGSSSIKYQLVDLETGEGIASGLVEKIGEPVDGHYKHEYNGEKHELEEPIHDHEQGLKRVLGFFNEFGPKLADAGIVAVGHRVVQGGSIFPKPALVTNKTINQVKDLAVLAPLHNGPEAKGAEVMRSLLPDVPQIFVFDSSFFFQLPKAARTYALNKEIADQYHIRRYGAHGTSHEFISSVVPSVIGKPAEGLKQIVLHIGNGASASAEISGKPVETSMGLTPLEGVLMGTRSGDVDPAVLEYIMDNTGMDIHQMLNCLNKKSGFAGLSCSSDMRDVKAAAEKGDEQAKAALDVWTYRIQKYIGAYNVAVGGADAIVFTAGIGENDCEACEHVINGLSFMGVKIDPAKNKRGTVGIISTDDSTIKVLRIPTNEELPIARDTLEIVSKL